MGVAGVGLEQTWGNAGLTPMQRLLMLIMPLTESQ